MITLTTTSFGLLIALIIAIALFVIGIVEGAVMKWSDAGMVPFLTGLFIGFIDLLLYVGHRYL